MRRKNYLLISTVLTLFLLMNIAGCNSSNPQKSNQETQESTKDTQESTQENALESALDQEELSLETDTNASGDQDVSTEEQQKEADMAAKYKAAAGYTVKPGDTLSEIAAQYEVTVQQLVDANNIEDPDQNFEGQILVIPYPNVYLNSKYGFNLNLPDSWIGFTVLTEEWEGTWLEADSGIPANTRETGLVIYIRHPLWTAQNPRQDIPLMMFTPVQWEGIQQQKFMLNQAAPIDPSELGRNSQYVFGLPPRYNYAFLTGFEEVADILNNNALEPLEIIKEWGQTP